MLTEPQPDPLGTLILEARADSDVASLVGTRVRGFEPADGDARPKGEWQAFVVLSALSVPIDPSVPISFAEYGAACYGSTPQNAWAVWGALAKAFHGKGPRTNASGLIIYRTAVSAGGEQDKDPDTSQPLVRGTIQVIVAAQAVA